MRTRPPLTTVAVAFAVVTLSACTGDAQRPAGTDPSPAASSEVFPTPMSATASDPNEFTEADVIEVYRVAVPRFLTTPADLGWDRFYPKPTVSWDRLAVRPVLSANLPPLPGFEPYGTADVDMPASIRSGLDALLRPIAPISFGTDLGVPGNDPENCTDDCGLVTISNVAFDGVVARVLVRVDNRFGTNATEYTLRPDGAGWQIVDIGEPFRGG